MKHNKNGVRQGCILSPTYVGIIILFNLILKNIINKSLLYHKGTISIEGRVITNLRFTDDIDGLAGIENELVNLINKIDSISRNYGMEINTNKTKITINCEGHFNNSIFLHNEVIESVDTFKYSGSILDDNGSTKEILSRIVQMTASLTKLNPIWNDRNVTLNYKIRILHLLVNSIF